MMVEKFDMKGFVRAPRLPYSPGLSPCDFWFFGMIEGKFRIRNFIPFKIFPAA
jgi:hypothetical protein